MAAKAYQLIKDNVVVGPFMSERDEAVFLLRYYDNKLRIEGLISEDSISKGQIEIIDEAVARLYEILEYFNDDIRVFKFVSLIDFA